MKIITNTFGAKNFKEVNFEDANVVVVMNAYQPTIAFLNVSEQDLLDNFKNSLEFAENLQEVKTALKFYCKLWQDVQKLKKDQIVIVDETKCFEEYSGEIADKLRTYWNDEPNSIEYTVAAL